MRNKFIVFDMSKQSTEEYTSLKAVQRAYPNTNYFQLYQVYLQSIKKTNRKQQPNNDIAKIYDVLRIYDNTIDFKRTEEAVVVP